MRMIKRCVVALAATTLGACSLDLQNPNNPNVSKGAIAALKASDKRLKTDAIGALSKAILSILQLDLERRAIRSRRI